MASNPQPRRPDPLAMQIYAAMLGGPPKVARRPAARPRLKVHVRVETQVFDDVPSPFRAPSLKQTLERAAADAISALTEAGERLRRSRAKVRATPSPEPARLDPHVKPTPVVLIGPAVRRPARVATPSRSAAA